MKNNNLKQYILIAVVCLSYQGVRSIAQNSTEIYSPVKKTVVLFCKDVIKAIDPKEWFKDASDSANDFVDS